MPYGVIRPQWVNIHLSKLLKAPSVDPSGAETGISHWGRVTHISVGNINSIGSENGLSPGRRQAIIWTKWLVAWSAPSHYLNQCWNIFNWTIGNKLQWNSNRNSNIFIQENAFENVVSEMAAILSRPQCDIPKDMVNAMSADTLAPCVCRLSPSMVLAQDKCIH